MPSQPGENITGLASQYEDVVTEQVQLLAEAVPGLSRLVFLGYKGIRAGAGVQTTAATAAGTLGLKTQLSEVREVADFEGAFRAAREGRAQAIHVLPSPFFNAHRRVLINLAARYRLPAMYEFREYVQDGGFMSYGASRPDMYRRAGELRRSHPQGGEAGRPSDRAAHQVRAGRQPQDRQGTRPDDPAVAARAGG
jgi:putative ABC transport system substrate-binding protein